MACKGGADAVCSTKHEVFGFLAWLPGLDGMQKVASSSLAGSSDVNYAGLGWLTL